MGRHKSIPPAGCSIQCLVAARPDRVWIYAHYCSGTKLQAQDHSIVAGVYSGISMG